MLETIFVAFLCHFFGEYVLTPITITLTKATSPYSYIIHAFLYLAPFYIMFGWNAALLFLALCHATNELINYINKKARFYIEVSHLFSVALFIII